MADPALAVDAKKEKRTKKSDGDAGKRDKKNTSRAPGEEPSHHHRHHDGEHHHHASKDEERQRSSVSINMLPVAILTKIASYAHVKPRTQVIALVCKRWRMAAFLSIQRLGIAKPDVCADENITALLALVPSLTGLTVSCNDDAAAPRSLRSLFVEADLLPHLTWLRIGDISGEDLPHFTRFVRTHTRLTELDVHPGPLSALWTALEGLALRKLRVTSDAVARLTRLIGSGRIDSLDLACSVDTFLSLPAHCVGNLASLTITDKARTGDHLPDVLEQLCHFSRSLTRLTLAGGPSEELMRVPAHRDLIMRTASIKEAGAERWPDVCLWRRVETLHVLQTFADSPSAHATVLPHLRDVQLGDSGAAAFDAQRGLALAADFLRTHPTIAHMQLHVSSADTSLHVGVRALLELALVRGLRRLVLQVPRTEATVEALCREVTGRGWLRALVVVGEAGP